jgi:hypothetical protein
MQIFEAKMEGKIFGRQVLKILILINGLVLEEMVSNFNLWTGVAYSR